MKCRTAGTQHAQHFLSIHFKLHSSINAFAIAIVQQWCARASALCRKPRTLCSFGEPLASPGGMGCESSALEVRFWNVWPPN